MPRCKFCAAPIRWKVSPKTESWYPVSPKTGRLHICGQARLIRERKAQGQHLKAITTEP
jgi:hypothetical protein